MKAMSDSVDHRLDEAIASACRQLGFDALKPQQYKAIRNFMEGKDVFVVLPTGFRKSFIFGILPLAYDLYLSRTAYSIMIVITPLAALMKEFKKSLLQRVSRPHSWGNYKMTLEPLKESLKENTSWCSAVQKTCWKIQASGTC